MTRIIFVGFLVLAFGTAGCRKAENQDADSLTAPLTQAEKDSFDSPRLPLTNEGKSIKVVSDSGVEYRLLESQKLPNGNLEVLTRRDGPSGTSFARREVDCGAMTFRYLGEGDSLEDARRDAQNLGSMAEAMSTSISGEVARFACSRG